MNIVDAAKSGRKIRRKGWVCFYDKPQGLERDDYLADDWEVEPVEKKTVKRWLWAKESENTQGFVVCKLLLAENELSNPREWVKLPWSETEFEE